MSNVISPLKRDELNLTGAVGAEFPRLLYRKTDQEDRNVQTLNDDGSPKTWLVTNKFDGKLCETIIADNLDHAEHLAAEGWETSPAAAYGEATGIAAATSAKDEENARLRAELEALRAEKQSAPATLSVRQNGKN